ncbi:chorismate synthase [Sediminispirochaeta bajacaliforniensis]|uniref:chorismate synthase n=1 Tax=Sediminispirochaeta bajacaliforniensis TaxID=148 RepID=UPI00035C82DD|nr:chorismate synthase [Sediminispirochaeta bajacaliforniensis]
MAGNSFGTRFRITSFGESHGKGIGVVVDGMPPGIEIAPAAIQFQLDRRKPGQSQVTTPRKENDQVEILSGVFKGKSTGTPIAMFIANRNQKSGDYDQYRDIYRPGHADFGYDKKYGIRDHRGGGRSSGRETAARVAAGALARLLLEARGIRVQAWTLEAAGIRCETCDPSVVEKNPMRACDPTAAEKMLTAVTALAEKGNSAGGIVECTISGVPAGIGDPVFDKLDARLAGAVISIGAVKGIEFGVGFAAARMAGKADNDEMDGKGFLSNNAGGILGGISTGEPIIFRLAVKPTPSISLPQKTIDSDGREQIIEVRGRHDPCICPRIVPVVEAMAALTLVDFLLAADKTIG